MERLIIEVLDNEVYKDLKEMEEKQRIHIVNKQKKELSREERRKLFESLQGSLSDLSYEKLLKELEEMRNEWERDF